MAALIVLVACSPACTGSGPVPDASTASDRPSPDRFAPERDTDRAWGAAACEALPAVWLERIARGYRSDRSGEVQIVPLYPNQIDPGLPHNGPWDEVQDVPLFFYGPGVIPAEGRIARPVTVADIAPTVGALAGSTFAAPDGTVLHEALEGPRRPRLVVVLIWDAVGRGVLDRHANAWPTLASVIDDGVWYERATVGSSPSQTAQVHATIGTGAFPRTHGLIAHRFRVDGELVTPWGEGTALLEVPTVGDVLDVEHDNAAEVGFVGTLMIHLGLLGHGSDHPDGDADLAVLREQEGAQTLGAEGEEWNLPEPVAGAFTFPSWVAGVEPGLASDVDELDRADGSLDGMWRGNDIASLLDGFDTPARAPYQQRVIEAVIEREGYGADERTTDVLWVNEKFTDYVSHVWSVDSPEMGDALRSQDEALARLLTFLDEEVGRGRWAIALTADHGSVRSPASTGAAVLSSVALQTVLERRFGEGVVELVQDTQLYLDTDRLERTGNTAADVARTVMSLSAGELALPDVDLETDARNAPAFEAAFPSRALEAMPCIREAAA